MSLRPPCDSMDGARELTSPGRLPRVEAFVVCEGFRTDLVIDHAGHASSGPGLPSAIKSRTAEEIAADLLVISPFIACGDLRCVAIRLARSHP